MSAIKGIHSNPLSLIYFQIMGHLEIVNFKLKKYND